MGLARLAEGMGSEPSTWDRSIVDELGHHLDADDIEWVAMSVGMMGFLNKFMDALSVPLEIEAIKGPSIQVGDKVILDDPHHTH